MTKDAFAKMDVQSDLFMKTTQPQKKWGKEELLKDYAAIMKQLQPEQVKLIAGEQWAMMKDALYKEDRVCVPEFHLEQTLRWYHTVNSHPAVQRSLWFFNRHFDCNKNKSEKKELMTAVAKDCHCILGTPNSQVDRGETGNLPIAHMVNSVMYLDFMHLPHYVGHNFALLVTCGLSRFVRVFPMKKKADSETLLKTLFEERVQVYGLPKVIHSDQDVRLTAAGNWYRGVLETVGCEIQFGTPYLRTKNALCKRQVRSFKTVMRILMAQENGRNWLRVLPCAIYLMNNQVSMRTGYLPHELFFGHPGFHMEFPTPQDANPKVKEWMEKQAALASKAKELLQKIRERENIRSNPGRKAFEYQIRDMVLLHHKRLLRWKKNDLDRPYYAPFMVTDVGPSSVKVRASPRFEEKLKSASLSSRGTP